MEAPYTIIGIAIGSESYRRLEAIAAQERTTVAHIASSGVSTYLSVLTDEAIIDQIRGHRPIPFSA